MRAQVVLTPTESKKLIAKAVARLGTVRKAFKEGIIAMHPSSSTYFVVEELVGHVPKTDVWVCGVVTPKALCVEMGMAATLRYSPDGVSVRGSGDDFRGSWIIKRGELSSGQPLAPVLSEMGSNDVYIKGVNAVDPQGKVGVLIGGESVERVTLGRALAARRERGIQIVFPVGLEKLIPTPVEQAAQEAGRQDISYSMGATCHLFPCEGTVITEIQAIDILSGAVATAIAAGGLGGAEGAVVLGIKGDEEQVKNAIYHVEQSKGARLPQLRLANCHDCFRHGCAFPVGDKHWA